MSSLFKICLLCFTLNGVFNKKLDNDIEIFIFKYFSHHSIKNVIHFSTNYKGHLSLAKLLSLNGMRFNLQNEAIFQQDDVNKIMKTDYYKLGIILDLSQPIFAEAVLNQILEYPHLFNILHYWLIVNMEEGQIPNALAANARLDSHIFILMPRKKHSMKIQIQELFRFVNGPLEIIIHDWEPKMPIPEESKRDNFQLSRLNVAYVIVEEPVTMESFLTRHNPFKKHLNTPNKLSFQITRLVQDYYNFSMNLTLTDRWGYKRDENGIYQGMVGLLQQKKVDTGNGLLMKTWRMDYIDYCGKIDDICPRFIFRRPPISANKNIYMLAFSMEVWLAFLFTTILTVLALCATEYLGDKNQPFEEQEGLYDYSWAAISIMALQGLITSPTKISSRVVLIFLLIVAVIFDNAYSASIVVLFQTPNNFIRTLEDLINSPFRFQMEDLEYNALYINHTQSPIIKRLYWEKIFTQPWNKAFVKMEEGIKGVRKGLHAFHVDLTSNKVISDTFDEDEKCSLQEISMFKCQMNHLPVAKGSPLRNHFKYTMALIREAGLINREIRYFYPELPKCVDQGHAFVSVSMQDIKPVIIFFFIGALTSVTLLLIEILLQRIIKKKHY